MTFSYPQEAQLHSTVTSGTFGNGAAFLLLLYLRRYCHRRCYCHRRPLTEVALRFHPGLLLRGSYHWPAEWFVLCILSPQDLASSGMAVLVVGMLSAAFVRRRCICGGGFIGSPGWITSTMF